MCVIRDSWSIQTYNTLGFSNMSCLQCHNAAPTCLQNKLCPLSFPFSYLPPPPAVPAASWLSHPLSLLSLLIISCCWRDVREGAGKLKGQTGVSILLSPAWSATERAMALIGLRTVNNTHTWTAAKPQGLAGRSWCQTNAGSLTSALCVSVCVCVCVYNVTCYFVLFFFLLCFAFRKFGDPVRCTLTRLRFCVLFIFAKTATLN